MRLKSVLAQGNLLTPVGTTALAWVLAAGLSTMLLKLDEQPSPVWFPAGVALAAVLLHGPIASVGVALAAFGFALWSGQVPVASAIVMAAGSTLGAIAGERLLNQGGFRRSFANLQDVLGFVTVAVLLSPIVNATLSSLNALRSGAINGQELGLYWWSLWLGDAMGVLVVTPLVLTWCSCPLPFQPSIRVFWRGWQRSLSFRQRVVEVLIWAVLLLSTSWKVFHVPFRQEIASYPLEYLLFPFLVWAALRLGQRLTVLSSLVVSVMAIAGAGQQRPALMLMNADAMQQSILLLQAFIGVMTVTALMLAAAVAERQQAEALLRKREASLLNAQRIAQVGSWDVDLPPCCALSPEDLKRTIAHSLRWSDELYRILGLPPQSCVPSLTVFLQRVHPQDRERVELAVQRVISERSPYRLDYRILLPDSSERLVSELVEVSATGITGTVQDITDRTLAEMALRESEARFRSMFEAAGVGIGLDDLEGKILESNPALQQMLGYSREELCGMKFADFTHAEDLAADWSQFQAMVAGQIDAYRMEKRQIRRDGQVVWVRLTNSLVRDAVGNPKFTIGMVENITERKQAEAALQHSEARFRVVAETTACSVMVYQGSRLRYVNPATIAITEYSEAELLTMDFWDLAHPEFRETVRHRGLARQEGANVPQRYEIKILTKTGQERWVDFTGGSISYEGRPAGMATAYDITDRKQAEAKLLQSAERERLLSEIALRIRRSLNLEEILNTTVAEVRRFLQADRVFITHISHDGQSHTVAESVDPCWNSILDWVGDRKAVQEIKALFETDLTLHHPGTRQMRVVNDTAQVQQSPLQAEYYARCQVRAGMGVPLMLDGNLFGLLIVNQCSAPRQWQPLEIDLLEHLATQVEIAIQQGQLYQQVQRLAANLERQVEDRTAELQQRMQELQNLNQVKDLLLHAVSHDLRTPVQGMLMVLNRLRSKCGDTVPVSRSMLERMIESSDHQLHLLNSLMENHCHNKPDLRLTAETIALNPVLTASLQALQPLILQNQTVVLDRTPLSLPLVKAGALQLQQVFEQLFTNAIKHNPPAITITVEAKVLDAAALTACLPSSVTQPGAWLYCTVADNGIGMTAAQCDRLFQLYVRGIDNQHCTGIGLGLHRCRQMITAYGGQIGVESQPGAGSTFWFTLPIATDCAAAPPAHGLEAPA